jgi:hypothetical protein
MIEDDLKVNKYILINTKLQVPYARIFSAILSKKEAQIKNRAFDMNKANKKYILESDWK